MGLSNRNLFPIAQADPGSRFAESYRTITTNIEFSSTASVRSMLVTSARPGEGKTSTAANLAIVNAQMGKRVLLIDADLRNPQVHKRFLIEENRGLSQVLRQEFTLQEAIRSTDVTGLHLLLSGPPTDNASSLLSSLSLSSLITKCKSQFDLVVLDTPPVLAASDALIITRHVDGVVFVVDAKKTNRFVAQRAISAITQVKGTILGGVLNRAPKGTQEDYYYGVSDKSKTQQAEL